MEKIVNVDVYDQDVFVEHLELPIKVGENLVFPNRPPYNGLSYFISSCVDGVYSFSPDGYEMWIKFSDKVVGRCGEYLIDRTYTFLFKVKN